MTDRVAASVRITGRVQGVYYRGWTAEQAARRGLTGWVRNLPDGSVEALFIGPRPDIQAMLAACRDGPRDAVMSDVASDWLDRLPPANGFEVLR